MQELSNSFTRASVVLVDGKGDHYGLRWNGTTLVAVKNGQPGTVWIQKADGKVVLATDEGKGTIVWRLETNDTDQHYKALTTSAMQVTDAVQLNQQQTDGGQVTLDTVGQDKGGEGSQSRFSMALKKDLTSVVVPSNRGLSGSRRRGQAEEETAEVVLAPRRQIPSSSDQYQPVTLQITEEAPDHQFAQRVDEFRTYSNNFCPDWAAIVMIVLLVIVIILVVVFAALSAQREVVEVSRVYKPVPYQRSWNAFVPPSAGRLPAAGRLDPSSGFSSSSLRYFVPPSSGSSFYAPPPAHRGGTLVTF